jgi:hypothetical protein
MKTHLNTKLQKALLRAQTPDRPSNMLLRILFQIPITYFMSFINQVFHLR